MYPSLSAPRTRTANSASRKGTRKRGRAGGGGKEREDSRSTNWSLDFETRRDLNLEEWNKPYVKSQRVTCDDDESVIRAFMVDRNEPEACQPQADKVDGFCGPLGLEDCPEGHLVILLDDTSLEPGKEGSREYLGPLTPPRALEELQKPVSRHESRFLDQKPLFKYCKVLIAMVG